MVGQSDTPGFHRLDQAAFHSEHTPSTDEMTLRYTHTHTHNKLYNGIYLSVWCVVQQLGYDLLIDD